jgi:hypothetical protein
MTDGRIASPPHPTPPSRRKAFSSLELVPGLITLGLVATWVGLPVVLERSEREKASDAIRYLQAVEKAQNDLLDQCGVFANSLSDLDLERPPPAHFSVGRLRTDQPDGGWSLTLRRCGASAVGFGDYRLTWTDRGVDLDRSRIPAPWLPK